MRFSSVLLMALSAVGSVSAKCTGIGSGTPSPNALRLFVSHSAATGNFASSDLSNGQTGLVGADNICNGDAQRGNFVTTIPELVTRGQQGLFKAILSNQLTDAAARFGVVIENFVPTYNGPVDASWDVVDATGRCLAASVGDLFDCGHTLDSDLKDSTGKFIQDPNKVQIWSGSLCQGIKYFKLGDGSPQNNGQHTGDQIQVQQAYCSLATTGGDATNTGYDYDGFTEGPQVEIGIIGEGGGAADNDWISKNTFVCTNALQFYCLQYAQPSQVSGDPQFVGLQGQSFQVHGMPDEFFNLITTPDMQLNSRFTYLASGTCNYNNTECWTHPGTYVDQLGFMFPGLHLATTAGSHVKGMIVSVNDQRLEISSQSHTYIIKHHHHHVNTSHTVVITYQSYDQLIVETELFTITVTNSDLFFNFGVTFHSPSLLSAGSTVHHITSSSSSSSSPYPSFPLHGLLGQTWKNARYEYGRMYQGDVDDYMLTDGTLFSNKFVFNQYQH